MRRMPNIELTQKEYENIARHRQISSGGEGIVCKGIDSKTAYKFFVEYDSIKPIGMLENKERKIISLYENPILGSVQPLSTISMDGHLIGYEMTYDKYDISFENALLPRRQIIRYLKQSSEILKYFASKDIIYGDVRPKNILINIITGQAKFCDMDNIQLKNMPMDLLVDYIDSFFSPFKYYSTAEQLDSSVDVYMHNLMTLQKLSTKKLYYDELLIKLENKSYKSLKNKKAQEIVDSMSSQQSFIPEYVVQYMKKIKFK